MGTNNVNNRRVDRNTLMMAMRRHLRIEGTKTVRNFDKETFLEDAENYLDDASGNNRGGARRRNNRGVSPVPRAEYDGFGAAGGDMMPEEDLAADGRKIGKRRKKKKRGKSSSSTQQPEYASGSAAEGGTSSGVDASGSGNDDDVWEDDNYYSAAVDSTSNGGGGGANDYDNDADAEEEEISIFGQTAGASNATWVECDRCKKVTSLSTMCKTRLEVMPIDCCSISPLPSLCICLYQWRRLRGVVDARKLPTRWFCSMNKNDPNRARCSAPEEEYE